MPALSISFLISAPLVYMFFSLREKKNPQKKTKLNRWIERVLERLISIPLKRLFRLDNTLRRVMPQNCRTHYGNNNLNFQLASDMLVYFEAVPSVAK